MPSGFRGARDMVAKMRKAGEEHRNRLTSAAYVEANIEATEMKKRTPVDTRPNAPHPGNLRDSIHVVDPEWVLNTLRIIIATGAQASEYDLHVHENPDAIHPIGQWKYMESVFDESRPYLLERIAKRAKL